MEREIKFGVDTKKLTLEDVVKVFKKKLLGETFDQVSMKDESNRKCEFYDIQYYNCQHFCSQAQAILRFKANITTNMYHKGNYMT